MKLRHIATILSLIPLLSACEQNTMSKIPQIGLTSYGPQTIRINRDTLFMQFKLQDGDADLGTDQGKDIFIKDVRFESAGFVGYPFPEIDRSIEDPKKGITGVCEFRFTPDILSPRNDSIHAATGDTTHFEFYIMDRAGNKSNTEVTPQVILRW